MRVSGHWLRSAVTTSLVLSLALPFSASAQQQDPATQPQPGNSPTQAAPSPDSPQTGAGQTGQQGTGESGAPQAAPAKPILPVNDGTQPNANPQGETPQTTPKAPLGTAAAPYEKGIGVAASRPAGAVIAPAKQRRTRTILIRVAVLVAAAVAVGTVVGLSSASPSSPH